MSFDSSLSRVSDAEVVARLTKLVQSGRRVTAEILVHLAEIEDRRLHLKAGHPSLFAYCLAVHGMSEDEACLRIEVARLGRRFSPIFGLLASGALSLSVAALLKDYLTDENHTSLLTAVAGKSVRAAREELAARFPMPDVPSTIRKLPNSTRDIAGAASTGLASANSTRDTAGAASTGLASANSTRDIRDIAGAAFTGLASANSTRDIRDIAGAASTTGIAIDSSRNEGDRGSKEQDDPTGTRGRAVSSLATITLGAARLSNADRARVEPIASERYRVQFTASAAQKQKLERALDLMSHQNPSRDLATTVERGLDLLIAELLRKRMGNTSRPRRSTKRARERVSNETRRVVAERDGLRCAFVAERGQRCEGRAFLEFDHEQPLGKGGSSEPGNVRLLCRAHNRYCAELEYGRSKIAREIARKETRGSAKPGVD